jgi:16S rRNA (uracil1498-N3)-methyltransferase
MSRRFFDPQPFTSGESAELGEDASHHIARVLRMRPADAITIFNGEGGEWSAVIDAVGKKSVMVNVGEYCAADRTPALPLHIALPVIKGERMDVAIQKATELGATSFQLLETARSDVRLGGDRLDKKLGHWQRVAISACEQCGMNRVPRISPPISLAEFLEVPRDGLTLFGQPAQAPLSQVLADRPANLWLVTGPEGGFSDEEVRLLTESGAQAVTLGERVLRAETAPLALLASVQALMA